MQATRILLVEDDPVTLASLAAKVADNEHLDLIAAVANCEDALNCLRSDSVDVVLTDLDLPDGDGTQIIQEAKALHPELLAMVISIFGDEQHVVRAIRAGASGYLLKDESADGLGESISQLLQGFSPISPTIAHHLIRALQPTTTPESGEKPAFDLSERESEVLNLAAKGYTYQEIADLIGVSINTVSTYTRRIYNKLAVSSKTEAIFEASRLGLMN